MLDTKFIDQATDDIMDLPVELRKDLMAEASEIDAIENEAED